MRDSRPPGRRAALVLAAANDSENAYPTLPGTRQLAWSGVELDALVASFEGVSAVCGAL